MQRDSVSQAIADFVDRFQGIGIRSTGANVTDFDGILYNVDGSGVDPKIDGKHWKALLIGHGITGECCVTNQKPTKSSTHANFSVGGHMTENEDGSVEVGGKCYLMPLCHWHNSKARDGKPFEHTKTKMLQLSGYMQAEPLVTFMARMDHQNEFSIAYLTDDSWKTRSVRLQTHKTGVQISCCLIQGSL